MATTCLNCKARLSCGCQKRKASNGTLVCSNCITKYEAGLKQLLKPQISKSDINKLQNNG